MCGMFSKHINRSKNTEFNVEKDHTAKKLLYIVLNTNIIDSFFSCKQRKIYRKHHVISIWQRSRWFHLQKRNKIQKKHSSFVRKNRQKPRRTEVVKLFCGAFVIKMAMKSFSKQITMRMEKKFLQLSTI